MPKPASPPLPERITSGQLARLVGVTERTIAARRLDGRLETEGGAIDLAALVRAGLNAGRSRASQDKVNKEAWSLAQWAATCAAAAVVAPLPGETAEQAAARGLRYALNADDFFFPPGGWAWPEQLTLADVSVSMTEDHNEEELANVRLD